MQGDAKNFVTFRFCVIAFGYQNPGVFLSGLCHRVEENWGFPVIYNTLRYAFKKGFKILKIPV
jgi:hypothetical protein